MAFLALILFIAAIAVRALIVSAGAVILLMNVNDLFYYYAAGMTPPDAWPFFWLMVGLAIALSPVSFKVTK